MILDCMVHIMRYPDHFNRSAMLARQPARRKEWSDDRWTKMWDNPIEMYFDVAQGVDKSVITGFSFPQTLGIETPNQFLYETKQRYPEKLEWCCTVDPTAPDAAEEVERCVTELGAIGIGELSTTYGGYYITDPRCCRVWATAERLGVPILMHAGPAQGSHMPSARLIYGDVRLVDEIAVAFPKLKIVICHLGYPQYEDAAYIVGTRENVFADISALTFVAGSDRAALPRFLPQVKWLYPHFLYPILYFLSNTITGSTDKLIWGSDWSGTTPRDTLPQILNINEELRKHNLPEIPDEIIHNILHENWKKVFTL